MRPTEAYTDRLHRPENPTVCFLGSTIDFFSFSSSKQSLARAHLIRQGRCKTTAAAWDRPRRRFYRDLHGRSSNLHPKDPNYQLAVEAARQDRCFCNPGEEKFPPQNRDLSPDSEADSDEPEEIDSLENRQNSMASENGLVKLEYVKAVCPRSKRQLCNRSRPVYPLITGDSRWLRGSLQA